MKNKNTLRYGIIGAAFASLVATFIAITSYIQPVKVAERQEFAFRSALPSIALPAAVDGVVTLTGDYSKQTLNITQDNVTVVGSRTTVQCVTISADNVTVRDVDVINCNTYGVYISGKNAVFENNLIRGALRDGTLTSTSSSGATIRNNTYEQNGQSCIEIRGTGHTIEGNNCSGTVQHKSGQTQSSTNDADCFRFFGSGHLFKNNYCHDITYGAQPTGTNTDPHIDGFQTWGDAGRGIAHDIIFDGNVIILSGRGGGVTNKSIQLEGGSSNLTFRNNTFRTTLGLLCTTAVSGITLDHNTWVGDKNDSGSWGLNVNRCGNPVVSNNIIAYMPNGAGHIQGSPAQTSNNCVWQSGNPSSYAVDVKADPKFVNESIQDYHLQAGSLCAGKGVVFADLPTGSPTPIQTSITPSRTATLSLPPTLTLTFSPVAATVTRTATKIPTSGANGVIIPLYTFPSASALASGGTWFQVAQSKINNPSVKVVAIVNPANGAGASVSSSYTSGISLLRNAGVIVLGYTDSDYGNINPRPEIDKWKAWYVVDGIFVDEMSPSVTQRPDMASIDQYAKGLGYIMTVGNPGSDIADSYFDVKTYDVVMVYESPGLPAISTLANHPNKRDSLSVIPYNVASLDTSFIQAASVYVKYIFIQSDTAPNPWDSLPPYFDALVSALAGNVVPVATGTPSKTKTPTDVPPIIVNTLTLSITPTAPKTPTVIPPSATPAAGLCVKITWWAGVSIRPGASTSNVSIGSYTSGRIIPIEKIEIVNGDEWGRVNYAQWFAVKIGTRRYASETACP